MADRGRALVLGGGGVTGVAWEIGLLRGLAQEGVDLTTADLVVGTSAGSVVGAQILGGTSLDELYQAQVEGATGEIAAAMSIGALLKFAVAGLWPGDPEKGRAWLGRQSLKAETVPEAERRAVITRRVGRDDWPSTPLLIPAVEATTGRTRVFDRDSGVSLVDAVHASCAVPLTWPPATVEGTRYIDGGARSVANVDLAEGCDRLVVITPITAAARKRGRPAEQARRLGVPSALVAPSDLALSKMGRNPLDPAFRAPAAKAGLEQARREAEKISRVWLPK